MGALRRAVLARSGWYDARSSEDWPSRSGAVVIFSFREIHIQRRVVDIVCSFDMSVAQKFVRHRGIMV